MTISNELKSTFSLIRNGTAFTNPLALKITELSTTVAVLAETLEDLESESPQAFLPVSGLDGEVETLQPLIDLMNEIQTNTTSFLTHTNRLSGVTLPITSGKPIITTIMSVGYQYTNILSDLGEDTTGKYDELFGSIIYGEPLVNQFLSNDNILAIQQKLENERTTGNPVSVFASIESNLQAIKDLLATQAAADDSAFDTAMAFLVQYSLAVQVDQLFSENNHDTLSEDYLKNHAASTSLLDLYS